MQRVILELMVRLDLRGRLEILGVMVRLELEKQMDLLDLKELN